MNRVLPVLALVVVAGLGILWYSHHSKQRALGSGEVHVRNQDSAGNTPPGIAPAATAVPPEEIASADSPPPPPVVKPSAGIVRGAAAAVIPVVAAERRSAMTQPRGELAVPAADTIPRNPPSGMIFAGSGKYQLYRQGDITWRLNTDTGQACVIFATDMQWSKPRIYASGCGAS